MAYNTREYVDTTPAAPLDKGTLNKMVWGSLFLQASFNYERMQAAGWLWGILPGLEKVHTNKEDIHYLNILSQSSLTLTRLVTLLWVSFYH